MGPLNSARTQTLLTSLLFLTLASPLPLHALLCPWCLVDLCSCHCLLRWALLHCCWHRFVIAVLGHIGTPRGPLQVHLPCPGVGSWPELFSRPLASVWSPGQLQTGCLSPALPFLVLRCPLLTPVSSQNTEASPFLLGYGGWGWGAHGAGSPEDAQWQRPNFKCPSTLTFFLFSSSFLHSPHLIEAFSPFKHY